MTRSALFCLPRRLLPVFLLVTAAWGVAGCEQVEVIQDRWRPASPHGRYAEALRDAGLAETALGQAWLTAADQALQEAPPIDVPFREVAYFDPGGASATGYRLDLRQGQRLLVMVDRADDDGSRLFIDLFEVPDRPSGAYRRLASADSTHTLDYEIPRTRSYLVRIQPELLRGGRYAAALRTTASIIFPVTGQDSRAIRSYFGASRDGGRRSHHGVDIFAPRGTPTVAAADGYVTRVRTGGLGGKVVWMRDAATGYHYYYAHLDSQLVRANTRVQAGDTLGLVGNTGNARTTPPHLHFGIYRNGPVDPFPYVHVPREDPPALRADTSRLGQWVRVARSTAALHDRPDAEAAQVMDLTRHTSVRVLGAAGRWYRVRLPDGTAGFIAAATLEPAMQPLRQTLLATGRPVRSRPSLAAAAIDSLSADATVDVLGRFGDYLHITSAGGRTGWIAAD